MRNLTTQFLTQFAWNECLLCVESDGDEHNAYCICGLKIAIANSYCFFDIGITLLYLVFTSCIQSYVSVFTLLWVYSRKTWTPMPSFLKGEPCEWAQIGSFLLFHPNRLYIPSKSYIHKYFPGGTLHPHTCRNAIFRSGSKLCFCSKACVCDNLWQYIVSARFELRIFAVERDRITRSSIFS